MLLSEHPVFGHDSNPQECPYLVSSDEPEDDEAKAADEEAKESDEL